MRGSVVVMWELLSEARARREDAKTIAKDIQTMKDESKKLRKAAAKRVVPFQAGNTKPLGETKSGHVSRGGSLCRSPIAELLRLYSAEVAPGLLLRGKIDAQRREGAR